MKTFQFIFIGLLVGVSTIATAAHHGGTETVKTEAAIFAGGCFWCMEHPYDETRGVISTTSGYIGGHKVDPTYQEVSAGKTGHTEAVKVVFDPSQVSYETLLKIFWPNVDPTANDHQFCDYGSQYRPGIFYTSEEQKRLALASEAQINATKTFKQPLKVEITKATTFYPAEDYHQDYYIKNPLRYKYYRLSCGRDGRLDELWGKNRH
jgi:peptide-methionine (S)-S-oxide reductase